MGVIACSRNGCRSVMCDLRSVKHGNICNPCFNELLGRAGQIKISKFMKSKKIYVDSSSAEKKIYGTFLSIHR